jgi:hypothetical protein
LTAIGCRAHDDISQSQLPVAPCWRLAVNT